MFLLNAKALDRLKKDQTLQAIVAMNMRVSQFTVQRWIKENSVNLTSFTVLNMLAQVLEKKEIDLVEKHGHVYQPAI